MTAVSSGDKLLKVHIDNIRSRLNAERSRRGLAATSFTDPTITAGVTPLKAVHFSEIQAGLDAVVASTWGSGVAVGNKHLSSNNNNINSLIAALEGFTGAKFEDKRSGCGAGCTGFCSNSCAGTCTESCTGSCSQSCGDNCTATCGGVCQGGCGGGCSGCTGCTGCYGACYSTLKGACSYISGGCVCQSTCNNGCTSCTGCASCTGACQGCSSSCGANCSGCANICTGGCSGTCKSTCTGNCSNSCTGNAVNGNALGGF